MGLVVLSHQTALLTLAIVVGRGSAPFLVLSLWITPLAFVHQSSGSSLNSLLWRGSGAVTSLRGELWRLRFGLGILPLD